MFLIYSANIYVSSEPRFICLHFLSTSSLELAYFSTFSLYLSALCILYYFLAGKRKSLIITFNLYLHSSKTALARSSVHDITTLLLLSLFPLSRCKCIILYHSRYIECSRHTTFIIQITRTWYMIINDRSTANNVFLL